MSRLRERAADLLLGIGWALTWRLGRNPGRAAVLAVTCPDCGAHLQAPLTYAGKAMRLHDRAHDLLKHIEAAKGDIPGHVPEEWSQ